MCVHAYRVYRGRRRLRKVSVKRARFGIELRAEMVSEKIKRER